MKRTVRRKPAASHAKSRATANPRASSGPRTASKRRTATRRSTTTAAKARSAEHVALLVGTRKGAFFFHGDGARRTWSIDGPHFLGHIVHHMVLDPRDGRTMLMASRTGHLGPTIYRSTSMGRAWEEVRRPPAFPKAAEGEPALAVDFTFFLAPGHPTESDVWWAGTSVPGLFTSRDAGMTWETVAGWNRHPSYMEWNRPTEGSPNGAFVQWINIDPRDAAHMYVVTSSGGVFESHDRAATWTPLNRGVAADFMPDPDPIFGQDTHCLRIHPMRPDRLYQQSHCGIYRLDRPGERWTRIGDNMPREVGDIGFPIVLHPRDPDTAWVFPMDGTTVWPRTSPDGRPALYRTRDAGASWERQDRGLPREHGWYTVKRQAMGADDRDPVGLYFGTTGGELWGSANEGGSWRQLAAHLPEIFSVEAVMAS
jgi:photosystem II stability/assembly factor-like uncharacterized protein